MKTLIVKDTTEIQRAAQEAVHVIAEAANAASKTVAQAAAEAAKIANSKNSNDHDFLLTFSSEVKTKLDVIFTAIKDLSDGTAKRISDLENEKLSVKDSYPVLYKAGVDQYILDHGIRLSKLETNNTRQTLTVSGACALIVVLAGMLIFHLFGIGI
ncbi:MAG: hypothetical protein Q7S22_06155 [Candidatus Micrarchaeota archaeon]|nr:hypothetical protein [Candidatus Micrarchaeota archaeon]